jgi:hypothetical protein
MLFKFFVFAVFLLLFSSPVYAGDIDLDAIGNVIEIEGSVEKNGQSAAIDMPVYMDDKFTTGASARTLILLIDDTEITLGENAELTIDEYIFTDESATWNKGSFSILRGAFEFTSGLIGKNSDPDVTIDIPYGTIGLRGTTVLGSEMDGEYGIYVEDGEVDLNTHGGSVRMGEGHGVRLNRHLRTLPRPRAWNRQTIAKAKTRVALSRRNVVKERLKAMREKQTKIRELRREKLLKQRELHRDKILQHNEKTREEKAERRNQHLKNMRDKAGNIHHSPPNIHHRPPGISHRPSMH